MQGKIRGLSRNSHGRWQYRPSRKGLPKGAPRPKPIQLHTADFHEALAKVLALRGQGFALPGNLSRPLGEWAIAYRHHMVAEGRHRPKTSDGVMRALNALCEEFGEYISPEAVTRERSRDWLMAHSSRATANLNFRYCRGFFSWLVTQRAVSENPFSRMDLPPLRASRRDRFCTVEERDRLFEACDRDDLYFVLAAGFFGGLRINEIVNARWDWFVLRGTPHFVVRNQEGFVTKSGNERMVPLHSRLRGALERFTGPREGYVLHPEKKQGKNHLRWDPRAPFRALVQGCGLPWVSFHVMRHTFGSLHAIAGTPEIKIRRWMGITQAVFDRHYAGLSPGDSAIEAI